ncbi:MAG: DUF4129 domain-containing protein [Chloroflexota bacterium]
MKDSLSWNWLDDGVLPLLLAILRSCWIWPWLGMLQLFLVPDVPQAAIPLALIVALPLISYTMARRASSYSQGGHGSEQLSQSLKNQRALGNNHNGNEISWSTRLWVAMSGLVLILLIIWWQLYRSDYILVNSAWLERLGDSLIHWPEVSIPPAVLLILTTIPLWLRGLLDAGRSATHDTIWSTFLFGVFMMVLYLILISVAEVDRMDQLVTSILAMLGAGMGALAFSSLKITAGLDRALGFGERNLGTDAVVVQTPTTPMINRYWLMSVGGVVGILLGGGVLLTLLIAPEVLTAIIDGLWAVASFIGNILVELLLLITYVFAYIFFWLYQWIEPLLQELFSNFDMETEFLQELQETPEAPLEEPLTEPEPVPDSFRWMALGILTTIILLIFALVLRRMQGSDVEETDEIRESILSSDLLQEQLSSFWDRLMGRFRTQDTDNPFLALDGEETRQRIRAVYQRLLATADELGQPRHPHLTPQEYRGTLIQSRAGMVLEARAAKPTDSTTDPLETATAKINQLTGERFAPQLERITAGYITARYGDRAPSNSTVAEVESAWAEIEAELRRQEDESSEETSQEG